MRVAPETLVLGLEGRDVEDQSQDVKGGLASIVSMLHRVRCSLTVTRRLTKKVATKRSASDFVGSRCTMSGTDIFAGTSNGMFTSRIEAWEARIALSSWPDEPGLLSASK